MVFDENFWVNRDIACTNCRASVTGFTVGIEAFNQTIVWCTRGGEREGARDWNPTTPRPKP